MNLFSRFIDFIKKFKKFANLILTAVLLILIIVLTSRFENFAARVGGTGVEANEAMENLRQSVVLLSKDAQEMRSLMRLPAREYPILTNQDAVPETESNSSIESMFSQGLDYLVIHENFTNSKIVYQKFIESDSLRNMIEKSKLILEKTSNLHAKISDQNDLIYDIGISNDGLFRIMRINGTLLPIEKSEASKLVESLFADLGNAKSISNKLIVFRRFINQLETNPEIAKRLRNQSIFMDEDQNQGIIYQKFVKRNDGSQILKIGIDYNKESIFINDDYFNSIDPANAALIKTISNIKWETKSEILIDNYRNNLKDLSKDAGFSKFLSSKNLVLSGKERVDSDYYYFDILTNSNDLFGSFAIQKWEASLWLMDKQDIPISRLDNLDFDSLRKQFSQKKN